MKNKEILRTGITNEGREGERQEKRTERRKEYMMKKVSECGKRGKELPILILYPDHEGMRQITSSCERLRL